MKLLSELKAIFGPKSQQKILIKSIEKFLPLLDYEKKLRIKKASIPIKFFVKPAEEGRSRAVNPTFYLINTGREYNGICPAMSLAVIAASRAVCCRGHIEKKNIEPFSGRVTVSNNFRGMAAALDFKCDGPPEIDAEIRARIAGEMYMRGYPISGIAQMILTDASEVVKKYGADIEDSMYIAI